MTFSKTPVRFPVLLPLLLMLIVPALEAQNGDELLLSYERIFIRGSLSAKPDVLRDAATDDRAAEFYGALCERALVFALENADLFRDDPDMISVITIAIRGVGEQSHADAAQTLWKVFLRFPDNVIRHEVLTVLPGLGPSPVSEQIQDYITEQRRLHESGLNTDYQTLRALVNVLGGIGDDASYPLLFSLRRDYAGLFEGEAEAALYAVRGDLRSFVLKVILKNPPEEKLAALKLFLAKEDAPAEERGELAEAALETGLAFPRADGGENIRELCRIAAKVIADTKRVQAFPQALAWYHASLAAFRADPFWRADCIAAIECLAALESAEAAETLALQLGVYNSRAPSLAAEEEELALALVEALGRLAYKESHEILAAAASLSYPEEIRAAAQSALQKLQW